MATALGTASACFFAAKFFSFCLFCSEGRNSFPLLPLCCPTEIAILREILKGKNKISVWGNTWVKKNKNEISMAGWGGKTKLQFEGNSTPFQKVKIWKWKSNLFPGTKKIEKMQRAANKPYPNFVFSGNHPPPSDKKIKRNVKSAGLRILLLDTVAHFLFFSFSPPTVSCHAAWPYLVDWDILSRLLAPPLLLLRLLIILLLKKY